METEIEIWKDIPRYEGSYQASDLGRIRSLDRVTRHGHKRKGRVLRAGLSSNGYLRVTLSNGKPKTRLVHQLIAMAFHDHIPCGFERVVDHMDNDPLNNRADNLQIISNRENTSKEKTDVGISFHKPRQKWLAQIQYKGRKFHLGYFKEKQKALDRYQKALAEVRNDTFTPKPVSFTSKYKGVNWNKANSKWIATYKRKYLGAFSREEQAHQAYQNYSKEKA